MVRDRLRQGRSQVWHIVRDRLRQGRCDIVRNRLRQGMCDIVRIHVGTPMARVGVTCAVEKMRVNTKHTIDWSTLTYMYIYRYLLQLLESRVGNEATCTCTCIVYIINCIHVHTSVCWHRSHSWWQSLSPAQFPTRILALACLPAEPALHHNTKQPSTSFKCTHLVCNAAQNSIWKQQCPATNAQEEGTNTGLSVST